jgi:hypothetical protein
MVLNIILGVLISVFAISTAIYAYITTPKNLRSFYGIRYVLIAVAGIVAGILFIFLN